MALHWALHTQNSNRFQLLRLRHAAASSEMRNFSGCEMRICGTSKKSVRQILPQDRMSRWTIKDNICRERNKQTCSACPSGMRQSAKPKKDRGGSWGFTNSEHAESQRICMSSVLGVMSNQGKKSCEEHLLTTMVKHG